MTHPTHELRASLEIASRAVQQYGATAEQIDMIVALAQGSNDYNVLGDSSRLTKGEASRIIEVMVDGGATPDWTAHEKPAFEPIARKSGGQKRAEKAARDESRTATAIEAAGPDARRVRHVKFGAGTVLSEDNKAVTVLFDGQKKPMRMVPAMLANA